MDIKFYSFPMPDDGLGRVENTLREYEKREKDGEQLEQEVVDWMDYANNVLYANEIVLKF